MIVSKKSRIYRNKMRGRGRESRLKKITRSLKSTKIFKPFNTLFGKVKDKLLIVRVIAHMKYLKKNNKPKFDKIMEMCEKIPNKEKIKLSKDVNKLSNKELMDKIQAKTKTEIKQYQRTSSAMTVNKIMQEEVKDSKKLLDIITDDDGKLVSPEDMKLGIKYGFTKEINGKLIKGSTMLVGGCSGVEWPHSTRRSCAPKNYYADTIIGKGALLLYKIIYYIFYIIGVIIFSPVIG